MLHFTCACIRVPWMDLFLFCVPCETLFVEVKDQLRNFGSSELVWNQHGFVAILPLNEKSQRSVNVGGSDDLVSF